MKKLITVFLSVFLVFSSMGLKSEDLNSIQTHAESKYVVLEDFEGDREWEALGARANSLSVGVSDSLSRFGNKSLKMDYDFLGTEGVSGIYAQPKKEILVPEGTKKIGLWIYGDGAGHWLRFQMEDAAGNDFNIDLTKEQPNGVNWKGWKYVEADIPSAWKAPFKISKNGVRYMATKDDMKNKGTIYIDNIIALFDDIDEDVTNPEITSKLPKENSTIDSSKPSIEVSVKDLESGIDYNSTILKLDNKDIEYSVKDGKIVHQVENALADGLHEVYVEIFDKAGNHYFETWNFKLDSGNFSLGWSNAKDSIAGDSSEIEIIVNNLKGLSEFSFDLETSDHVKDLNFEVVDVLKDNYKYEDGRHFFYGINDFDINKDTLAKIDYALDPNADGELFIKIKNASYNIGSEKDVKFYLEDYKSKIIQPLKLSIEGISVGTQSELKIIDLDGKAVDGARLRVLDNYKLIKFKENGKVFKSSDGSVAGQLYSEKNAGDLLVVAKDPSDGFPYYRVFIENGEQRYFHVHKDAVEEVVWNDLLDEVSVDGKLKTNNLTLSQIPLKIQAYKGKLVSQVIELQVAPQLGSEKAENILFTWSDEVGDSLHLSWKTDTQERKSIVRYKQSKQRSSWNEVLGESSLIGDASGELRVHHAEINNLEDGVTYDFVIGDGSVWSEVKTYTTPKAKNNKSNTFTLVADSQAYDEEGFNLYLDIINLAKKRNGDTQFVLHAGDIVEEGNRLDQWDLFLKYQAMTNLPLVSVMGNHDVYGDGYSTYNRLIRNPQNGPEAYKNSVYYKEFGDARIIVLNSEVGRKGMEDQLEWLKEAIKSNEKQWTIVSFHRSPYKANPKRPDDVTMEVFAPVLEEMGVDLVITGHDHSYLRTYPMNNGKVSEEGPIYLIAGSSGPKFYPSENQEYAEFAYFAEKQVASNITITENKISIEAFNDENEVIDQFSLEKESKVDDVEVAYNKLKDLIDKANSLSKEDYTQVSYDNLTSKIDFAKKALAEKNIENMINAYEELQEAIDLLELVNEDNNNVIDDNSNVDGGVEDSNSKDGGVEDSNSKDGGVIPPTGMPAPILGFIGIGLLLSGLLFKFTLKKD